MNTYTLKQVKAAESTFHHYRSMIVWSWCDCGCESYVVENRISAELLEACKDLNDRFNLGLSLNKPCRSDNAWDIYNKFYYG